MGTRLEKYREKKKKKHRKIYGLLKFFVLFTLFIGLGISIVYVNKTIKDLNYIDNTVLFGINFEDGVFTILGKSYIIEFDKILRMLKPD